MICDAIGQAVSFILAPGQAHELPHALALLSGYLACHVGLLPTAASAATLFANTFATWAPSLPFHPRATKCRSPVLTGSNFIATRSNGFERGSRSGAPWQSDTRKLPAHTWAAVIGDDRGLAQMLAEHERADALGALRQTMKLLVEAVGWQMNCTSSPPTAVSVEVSTSEESGILALRSKVKAAQQEFDQATAYHEAWKAAVYNTEVQARMGRSYATGTFNVILQALRREMLLAMMRLWDTNSAALSLPKIANILDDKRIVEALVAECEQHWGYMPPIILTALNAESDAALRELVMESERKHGREQGDRARFQMGEASTQIRDYAPGGAKHETIRYLKRLRDQHLAHRQLAPSEAVTPTADDAAIEQLYQDMANVVRLLLSGVAGTDYRPEETAETHRRHAELFWAGVRGERTEGHPAYKEPKSLPDFTS